MKTKHILLSISAGALLGALAYNTCKADESVPGTEITGDNDTLTIEYSENYGEFGTRRYVFQQFGKECDMRYLEIQECPNARRNDGVLYGCNGLAYRDFDCNGAVDELSNFMVGGRIMIIGRSRMEEYGQAGMIDTAFVESRQEMEAKAGISLEEEVNKWRNPIQ